MKKIDLERWDRREIFEFFSPLSHPFYGLSFHYAMIWLVTRAVNGTEAFLYTIRGGEVFLLDRREPSFTDRFAGEKYFHIVTMPWEEELAGFCAAAAEKSRAQRGFIDYALLFLSSLPWLDLSALNNERDLDPDDAIPRIAWGKYTAENGRRTLGLSVEVNHRFVDGADVGAFAARLEELIAAL